MATCNQSKMVVLYGVVMASSEYKSKVLSQQGAKQCCDSEWPDYMNFCPTCGKKLKFINTLPHQKGAGILSSWGNVHTDPYVIVGFIVDQNIRNMDFDNTNDIYNIPLVHDTESSSYNRRINSELTAFCNQYDFECCFNYHVMFTPEISSF